MGKPMNLVSYALYGSQPKYLLGAVENARYWKNLDGTWQPIFYCDASVPLDILKELEAHSAIIEMAQKGWHSNGMFWRFKAAYELDFDILIVRDVDSRISLRELSAVDDWIQSNKYFHIMRDHPHHRAPILGGMWGVKGDFLKYSTAWNHQIEFGNHLGEDQNFLRKYLYPQIKHDALVHDPFFRFERLKQNFRTPRDKGSFVGESFDENNVSDHSLRKILEETERSGFKKFWVSRPELRKYFLN